MNTYDISLMQQSKYIDTLFTYKSDEQYNQGDIVIVPFGQANKVVEGIIVYKNISSMSEKTKTIISKLEHTYALSKSQIDIALFIRDNYMCTYYEAFKLFTAPSKYTKLSENYTLDIELIDEEGLNILIKNTRKNAKNKLKFLNDLSENKRINKVAFEEMFNISINKYIKQIQELGLIKIYKSTVFKENKFKKKNNKEIILNENQERVLKKIKDIYENEEKKRILLHGITGSGKTQVYINTVKYVLSKGKSAIILVPEISLTMQTIERFVDEFDEDIAVIHSALTKREKFEQWLKIKSKKSRIVIGARSALFSPLQDIGAIIVDECHDEAYKSEQSPKYDAIEIAGEIASKHKALVILSTATPTILQYYMAIEQNKYHLLELTRRANDKPLPKVLVVNMLEEMKGGNKSDLSLKLQLEMKRQFAKQNSVILFINKRGYSNQLICSECGYVAKCENCDISLTYHKIDNVLKCHYCSYEVLYNGICPACSQGEFIMPGSGTEKIELQVKNIFPSANVFRMDKDTVNEKGKIENILTDFRNSKNAVLIGTQMIGKGHDFPNVSLVGVINADQGINSPDYKALERSYNLIEQVGGRAGRGSEDGMVIVQTFSYANTLLHYIRGHNYKAFYEDELEKRMIFNYEPYGNIIRLIISSQDNKSAHVSAVKIKDALNFYNENKFLSKLKIYEVAPCLISKIEKKYRYQVVLRCSNDMLLTTKKMINYTLTVKRKVVLSSDKVSVSIDVNPDNML